jgi:hypothetical protein
MHGNISKTFCKPWSEMTFACPTVDGVAKLTEGPIASFA